MPHNYVTGDTDSTLEARNISPMAKPTQRLPYNTPSAETDWHKVSPRAKENPMVVSVTDGTHPARVRPFISPRGHGPVYLTDSVKNWGSCPASKSNSFNAYTPSNTHHRPGSVDPRFRKLVPNRKSNKSDIGTDTEDLTNEKSQCSRPHETENDKPAEDSECKTTKTNKAGRDKAEKPGEVVVPLKKALSVDCGVQTPEMTCKPTQKHKEPKILREIRHTASDISLGQISCETKRSYSEISFNCSGGDEQCWTEKLHTNKISGEVRIGEWIERCKKKQIPSYIQGDQNQKRESAIIDQKSREHDVNEHITATKFLPKSEHLNQYGTETEDSEWQTVEIHNYPTNENKSSVCVHLPKMVTAEKLVKHNVIGRETRSICSKKPGVKCVCGLKRHTRESTTNVTRKGSNKLMKDSCLHCHTTKHNIKVTKEDMMKLVLMVLGGVFVVTTTLWILTILYGLIPSIYEWFYPPPVYGRSSVVFQYICKSVWF